MLIKVLILPRISRYYIDLFFFQNLIQGVLVNGSIGKVEAFMSAAEARQNLVEIAQIERKDGGESKFTPRPDINDLPTLVTKTEVDESKSTKAPSPQIARVWPVVRFTNSRRVLCIPFEFTVESANGTVEAKREQVPLILAWALSVHKSQGQTIERVKVNLGKTFEKGQGEVLPIMTPDLTFTRVFALSLRRIITGNKYGNFTGVEL